MRSAIKKPRKLRSLRVLELVAGGGFVPQPLIDSSELTDSTIVRNAKKGDKGNSIIQSSFSYVSVLLSSP